MSTSHNSATPVQSAMTNEGSLSPDDTKSTPDSQASKTAMNATSANTDHDQRLVAIERMARPIDVMMIRVPSTACNVSPSGPRVIESRKAAQNPTPWSAPGTWPSRFIHIPSPYSRRSITMAASALARSAAMRPSWPETWELTALRLMVRNPPVDLSVTLSAGGGSLSVMTPDDRGM